MEDLCLSRVFNSAAFYSSIFLELSRAQTSKNSLFTMEGNLAEILQGMSLGEDKSIIIPDEEEFCAMDRGGRSILGRLLNPECQNMGRMLRTMPKVWKVYERARGIALTRERFQFIFDLETDIQTGCVKGSGLSMIGVWLLNDG